MSIAATPITASTPDFFTGSASGQISANELAFKVNTPSFDIFINTDSNEVITPTGSNPILIIDDVADDYGLIPLPPISDYPFPVGGQPLPQAPIRLATRGPISLRTRGRAPYTQTPAKRSFNNKDGTFFPVSGSNS